MSQVKSQISLFVAIYKTAIKAQRKMQQKHMFGWAGTPKYR